MIILLIIFAIIFYTAFGLFASKAGGKINDSLSAAIFNGIGAAVPLLVYLFFKTKQNAQSTNEGVIYSVLAGVSIAVFSVLLINIFSRAENVSFVMPTIYGGAVVLATVAGVFLFKESLAPVAFAGVLLVAIGVSMLIYSRIVA